MELRAIASQLMELEARISASPAPEQQEAAQSRWKELIKDLLAQLNPPGGSGRLLRFRVESTLTFKTALGGELVATSVNLSYRGLCMRVAPDSVQSGDELELVRIAHGAAVYQAALLCRVMWWRAEGPGQGIAGLRFVGEVRAGQDDEFQTWYLAAYRGMLARLAAGATS
jgi:hypothetical protein